MPPQFLKYFLCLLRQICRPAILLLLTGCAPSFGTAAWVIRYDLDSPAEVQEVCSAAKAAGIDALLVQVRGRADAFYRSSVAPRAETLRNSPEAFDPLQALLDSCGDIKIHAWLNVYYLWSAEPLPSDPAHPAHPSRPWFLHDTDGRSVADYDELESALGWIEGVYADPASDEYRKIFGEAVRELVERYPVAGIHLDFVRYPGFQYGQTGPLGGQFQEKWGIDPRYLTRKLPDREIAAWLTGHQGDADRLLTTANILWNEMRAGEVTELVRLTKEVAGTYGPPSLQVSAAVFPDPLPAYFEKGQDWLTWADSGLIDALYPMAYFGEENRVGRQLASIAQRQESSRRVPLWAGLGAYIKDPEAIAREAQIARATDYDGIALFSLGHLLKKPGQLQPYAEVMSRPPAGQLPGFLRQDVPTPALPAAVTSGANSSLALLEKLTGSAMADFNLPPEKIQAVFQERLAEFARSTDILQQTLQHLESHEVNPLPWAILSGVFRYVHPFDSEERKKKQFQICEEARQRLQAGADMRETARELSQGGSRSLGGQLGTRYLDTSLPEEFLLTDLAPGDISPVMEEDNGCWCYRIEEKGTSKSLAFSQLPWPAKRILYRQTLAELLRGR